MSEDHEAIRNLLASYCLHADDADTDGWLALYADGGSLDMGMGGEPFVGKDALRTFASARKPGTALHASVNPIIEVDGDRATVQSYIVVIGAGPAIRLAGRYRDELQKVDGRWLFASRTLTPQFVQGR